VLQNDRNFFTKSDLLYICRAITLGTTNSKVETWSYTPQHLDKRSKDGRS